MNRHTFSDVASGKRASLVEDLDLDLDDEEEDGMRSRTSGGLSIGGNGSRNTGRADDESDGEEESSRRRIDEDDAGETYEIEAFNLKEERDGDLGHFDGEGNYIFKRTGGNRGDEEDDAWLNSLDEATVEKGIGEAAAAMKKRQAHLLDQQLRHDKIAKALGSPHECRIWLSELLLAGETVTGALRRLKAQRNGQVQVQGGGGGAGAGAGEGQINRRRPQSKNKNSTSTSAITITATESNSNATIIATAASTLVRITDLSNQLMSNGLHDVFTLRKEQIWASAWKWEYVTFTSAGSNNTTFNLLQWCTQGPGQGYGQDQWQFQGEERDIKLQVHGPFTAAEMGSWKKAGYFTGVGAVPIRKVPLQAMHAHVSASSSSSSSGYNGASSSSAVKRKKSVQFANEEREAEGEAARKKGRTDTEDLLADLESDSGSENDENNDNDNSNGNESTNVVNLWLSSDSVDFPTEAEVEVEGDTHVGTSTGEEEDDQE